MKRRMGVKRKIMACLLALCLIWSMAGCADKREEAISVMALKGPTAMGMVGLMDASDRGEAGGRYSFAMAASVDEVIPALVQGQVDVASVPANLAAVLYNKTHGAVEVLAINTLGVLYVVEKGDSIQSVEDLRGRTIYASGKGATPEYALQYILEKNGIQPDKEVTIEWKSEHAEVLTAIAGSEDGIGLLPQPFVTVAQTRVEGLRTALDLTEEWNRIQEQEDRPSGLVMGVVVGRKDFLKAHPKALETFLEEYKESVVFVNENTDEAARLVGQYGIVEEEVARKALPACNITFIRGEEMKDKLSGYLTILMEQNPQAVGGTLPGEDFYKQ